MLYDGLEVAIKKFEQDVILRQQQMFQDECRTLRSLNKYKNVVSFQGYCSEIRMVFVEHEGRVILAEDRTDILVLAYIPNGSLEEITEGKHLDWSSCFKIIQEIAQGVHYIHEQRVIHLDLKPSNILFDSDMTPVICDFGSSKVLGPNDDEIDTDGVMGTVGYMAPEQYSNRVSLKSDMFGFGITLLRTIISKSVIYEHTTAAESSPWYGRERWERIVTEAGGLKGLVHPTIQVDESQLTEVNMCIEVGLLCTETDPADRPTMADVVDMLSGKKTLPTPKKKLEKVVTNMRRAKVRRDNQAFRFAVTTLYPFRPNKEAVRSPERNPEKEGA